MRDMAQDAPFASEFYVAAVMASAIAYLGIVLLFAISIGADMGSLEAFFGVLFIGGIYMAFPAIFVSFVITGPLGCLLGVAMSRLLKPGRWHGAVNGAVVATGLLLFFGWPRSPAEALEPLRDPGTALFALGLMGAWAGAGWFAQRRFLGWPVRIPDEDFEPAD